MGKNAIVGQSGGRTAGNAECTGTTNLRGDGRGKAICTAGNAPTHKVTAVKAAKIFPIFFNFIYSSHKFSMIRTYIFP